MYIMIEDITRYTEALGLPPLDPGGDPDVTGVAPDLDIGDAVGVKDDGKY